MSQDDRSYFQHRAQIEIERAETATTPRVAHVHHQLAEAYRDRLTGDDDTETAAL